MNKNYHINIWVNKTTKGKVIPIHPRLDLDVIGIYFNKKKGLYFERRYPMSVLLDSVRNQHCHHFAYNNNNEHNTTFNQMLGQHETLSMVIS